MVWFRWVEVKEVLGEFIYRCPIRAEVLDLSDFANELWDVVND